MRSLCSRTAHIAERMFHWLDVQCAACHKSATLRAKCIADFDQFAGEIISLYHPVFCYANALERVPQKIRVTNREDFDQQTFDLGDLGSAVTKHPSTGLFACDKNLYRVARLLQCVMNCLLAVIITYAVYFHDVPLVRHTSALPLHTLNRFWAITVRCCPQGTRALERVANSGGGDRYLNKTHTRQPTSLQPLRDFLWIAESAFGKLGSVAEQDPQSPAPPLPKTLQTAPPPGVSVAQYTRFLNTSLTLVQLSHPQAKYLAQQKNIFSCSKEGDSCFYHLKLAAERILKLRIPILEPGWLARCLDYGRDDLKTAALLFVIRAFAHDASDRVPAQKKLDLPTQSMIWSASPVVRRLVSDALILLSRQLPYKDGAFKRFIPLLLSGEPSFQRMGVRLFTQCRAINLTAISLAIRILITHGINSGKGLSMWIKAASDLAETNAPYARKDCMTAIQEFWTRSFESTQKPAQDENFEKAFLVFAGFALTVLCIHPGTLLLKTIPTALLDRYGTLKRLLPDRLTVNFVSVAPTQVPLAISFRCPAVAVGQEESGTVTPAAEEEEVSEPASSSMVEDSLPPSSCPAESAASMEVIEVPSEQSDGGSDDEFSESAVRENDLPDLEELIPSPADMDEELGAEDDTMTESLPHVVYVRRAVSTQFLMSTHNLALAPADLVEPSLVDKTLVHLPRAESETEDLFDGTTVPVLLIAITPPELASRETAKRSALVESGFYVTSPFKEQELVETEPGRWRFSWTTPVTQCNFELQLRNAERVTRLEDADGRLLAEFCEPRTRSRTVAMSCYEAGTHHVTFRTITGQ